MSVVSAYAIVNGTQIDLTKNSNTGMWEAAATSPATSSYNQDGHYYGVTITATDEAGNVTTVDVTDTELGEALQLVVKETVAPVISITSPTSGELTSNNTPTIVFTVTDDDSGVDADSITLTIDGTAVSGLEPTVIDGGYSVSYTPTEALLDGEHTVSVEASDNDGNAADAVSVSFNVLATAPSLAVTAPIEGSYTNESTITVEGTTDGTAVTVQVGSGDAVDATVEDGAFTAEVNLAEGENSITVTATSASGVTTTIVRTVNLDTSAPVISSVTLSPNPVNTGSAYTISVSITD